MIIRRCVPKIEQGDIIYKCHASPYGGHFVGDRTTHKCNTPNYTLTGFITCLGYNKSNSIFVRNKIKTKTKVGICKS